MTKPDFLLQVLANNLNIFTNPVALKQTVRDMLESADHAYEYAEEVLIEKKLIQQRPLSSGEEAVRAAQTKRTR